MRRDNARMGRTSVLPNIDPLPGAQCQAAASNGNREVHGSKGGTHVSGHVILALSSMHEQWIAITHETGKKTFQIAAHVRVGIFLDEQRGGGMAEVQCDQAVLETAVSDPTGDLVGEFIQTAAAGTDPKLL